LKGVIGDFKGAEKTKHKAKETKRSKK